MRSGRAAGLAVVVAGIIGVYVFRIATTPRSTDEAPTYLDVQSPMGHAMPPRNRDTTGWRQR